MHTSPHGNRKERLHANGMTLVELAVGLSILSISTVLIIGTIVKTYETIIKVSEVREIFEKGYGALNRITAEIKEAESVDIPGKAGLRIVKSQASSDGYKRIYFFTQKDVLYRKGEPGGKDRILAENVIEFDVTTGEVSSGIYTIRLTIEDADGEKYAFRSDIYPMNIEDNTKKTFYDDDDSAGDWATVISKY